MATKTTKPENTVQEEKQQTDNLDKTAIRLDILKKIGNPPNVSKVQIYKVNDHSARVNVWCREKTNDTIEHQRMIYSEFYKIPT